MTGLALELISGAHEADRLTFGPSAMEGVRVASGALLTLRRGWWQGVSGTGVRAEGEAHLVNVRMIGGGTAVLTGANGLLDARFATIADNLIGINRGQGGTVTLDHSIVFGNTGGDLMSVPCAGVSFSDTGLGACAGQNGSISANPMFSSGYRLSAGSPCLDAGDPPATYTGMPPVDLDGGLRLRDWDGDGLARADLGAYEETNPVLFPAEVMNLLWADKLTLNWNVVSGATEYNVYRGNLQNVSDALSYAFFGTCRNDLDSNRSDTALTVPGHPPAGSGWFFLITARDGAAPSPALRESTLGFGTSAERSNYNPCTP